MAPPGTRSVSTILPRYGLARGAPAGIYADPGGGFPYDARRYVQGGRGYPAAPQEAAMPRSGLDPLAKAEKRENGYDDDDGPDQPNDVVHDKPLRAAF